MASPSGQLLIIVGFHLAVLAAGPLTGKIIQTLGISKIGPSPFGKLPLLVKILVAPYICVKIPIWEEQTFRGKFQEALKWDLKSFYHAQGFSNSTADFASRMTAVFFTSVLFGLYHFTNAIFFCCNPVLFLPQVVFATILGLMLGFAKEWSGDLVLPSSMHICNNSILWTLSILHDLV